MGRSSLRFRNCLSQNCTDYKPRHQCENILPGYRGYMLATRDFFESYQGYMQRKPAMLRHCSQPKQFLRDSSGSSIDS